LFQEKYIYFAQHSANEHR